MELAGKGADASANTGTHEGTREGAVEYLLPLRAAAEGLGEKTEEYARVGGAVESGAGQYS